MGQPREHAGRGGNENEHELQPRPGRTVFTGHEVRQSLLLSLGRAVITKPACEEVRKLHPNSSTRAVSTPTEQHSSGEPQRSSGGKTHPPRATESALWTPWRKNFPSSCPTSQLRAQGWWQSDPSLILPSSQLTGLSFSSGPSHLQQTQNKARVLATASAHRGLRGTHSHVKPPPSLMLGCTPFLERARF